MILYLLHNRSFHKISATFRSKIASPSQNLNFLHIVIGTGYLEKLFFTIPCLHITARDFQIPQHNARESGQNVDLKIFETNVVSKKNITAEKLGCAFVF